MKNKKLIISGICLLIAGISFVFFINYFGASNSHQKKNPFDSKIRVVSLMPSLTQSIYYLGAQSSLVGCTSYCQAAKTDSIEVVSSVMNPNIEKIVSMKPTIVLVSGLIPEKDVETLQKFGIKVERFISPKSFDEICSEFIRLGKLVGKEDKAIEIVRQSTNKIQEIKDGVIRETKPKIFIQIGASPIHTVIPNTFMDDYINFCGGVNIANELTMGTIGREFVVSENPDIIFIVTMGIVGEEEETQWRQFKQMNAVKNNNIFIISSDIACQPTPITFIETLELMNKYITK